MSQTRLYRRGNKQRRLRERPRTAFSSSQARLHQRRSARCPRSHDPTHQRRPSGLWRAEVDTSLQQRPGSRRPCLLDADFGRSGRGDWRLGVTTAREEDWLELHGRFKIPFPLMTASIGARAYSWRVRWSSTCSLKSPAADDGSANPLLLMKCRYCPY